MIQGLAVHAAGAELHPYKYDPGDLRASDVEVAISHCAVSQVDVSLIDNELGGSKYPFIPGHEIVGTISARGANVHHLQVGDRVGVGWQADSCGHCPWCRGGQENLCSANQPTCVSRNGGFAEATRVDARFAVPLPAELDSASAAPLLCAGITVYRPMRAAGINPSSRVGVVGIGGLGHLALQFARAFGAEVTAFSSSAGKEEDANRLGAHRFVNTRESKSLKALAGHFDFILSTSSADSDWSAYVAALRPGGSLVFAGLPPKPVSLAVFPLVSGTKSLGGSNIGSPVQIAEMLDVAARHKVQATVEPFPMREANAAVARARKGTLHYRAVLAN